MVKNQGLGTEPKVANETSRQSKFHEQKQHLILNYIFAAMYFIYKEVNCGFYNFTPLHVFWSIHKQI